MGFLFDSIDYTIEWYLFWIKTIAGLHRGFKRVLSWEVVVIIVEDLIPGIYAINVTGKLPSYMIEVLRQKGVPIPENFEN